MARQSAVTNLHILGFSGGVITEKASGSINGIYSKYPSGNWYLTQRPSVNIFERAADTITDTQGRGIYYWNAASTKIFVNNDTVYRDSYAAPLAQLIAAGTDRVYLFEIGAYLVILDPSANQGWTINSATPSTMVQITDPDFLAVTLALGGAVLNGRLYVLDQNADILESDIDDPTAWNPLNFRNAELEPDDGVMMDMHHEHIMVIGTRTIEFFFDNANPTGSSIEPRGDTNYRVGAVYDHSMWSESDRTFWVGLSPSGGIAVYVMEGFRYRKVSTPDIDTFLNSAISVDSLRVVGSGYQIGGRTFYILTLYNIVSGSIAPKESIVYELFSDQWHEWELVLPGIDDCPVVGWTKSTTTRIGEGILSTGDLVTVSDDLNPQDTIAATQLYEDGLYDPGLYSATGASGNNITMEVTLGKIDYGSRNEKSQGDLKVVATPTSTPQSLTVQWSDNSNNNFNTGKSIPLDDPNAQINRMGSFVERNFKLLFAGDEQVEIEGIETVEE